MAADDANQGWQDPDDSSNDPSDDSGEWGEGGDWGTWGGGFDAFEGADDAGPEESWQGQLWQDVAWRDADDAVSRARQARLAGRAAEALEVLDAHLNARDDPTPAALLERGLALDDLGRLEDACDAYRAAADLDRDPAHALNHLGADLHALGRFADAADAFAAANDRPGGFPPATVNSILTHAELGDHDAAEEAFYVAQQRDERCPRSFFNVSRSLALRGRWERASWCLRRVLELDTQPAAVPAYVVHFHVAEAERQRAETAGAADAEALLLEARRHYGRCAALAPIGDRLLGEALARLAGLLLDAGDVAAAEPPVRRLLKVAPGRPAAMLLQGRVHLGRGENAAAGEALRRAAEADPTHPGVHLCLASLAAEDDRPADALRHLRAELLRTAGEPAALVPIAEMFTVLGDPAGAASALRNLVAVTPRDSAAWRRLGAAECAAGRHREGIAATRRALKLAKEQDPAAWHNLALALAEVGDLPAARRAARAGLARHPRHLPLRRLRLRLRLAWVFRRFG